MTRNIHEEVQEYYGDTLKSSDDLHTNACCTLEPVSSHIQKVLDLIAPEIKSTYYGCGLTIPSAVEGLDILDLGSGSGRDCYIASKLVGEKGSIVGVDMTGRQIEIANKFKAYHREKFGYDASNVQFLQANIEELDQTPLTKGSFDLIISNCVLNLTRNKRKVLRDAYNLLKPGGEMYFSDVYSDRRIPENLQANQLLWNECLGGALYWNDFLHIAKQAGFTDPRSMESRTISIENPELEELIGDIQFFSVTYRLMKIDGLESNCEDYGQAVTYRGGIPEEPNAYKLDDHHYFPKGKIVSVCGNTYKMLNDTRLKPFFDFYGSWDIHYGIFEGCGEKMPFTQETETDYNCC